MALAATKADATDCISTCRKAQTETQNTLWAEPVLVSGWSFKANQQRNTFASAQCYKFGN